MISPSSTPTTTFTDENGNYDFVIPSGANIQSVKLDIILTNQAGTFKVQYQVPRAPTTTLETTIKIDPSSVDTIANFKFQSTSPFILVNNNPVDLNPLDSSGGMVNVPVEKFPHLADYVLLCRCRCGLS